MTEQHRSLLSLRDLGEDEQAAIVARGVELSCDLRAHDLPLRGRVVGVWFTRTSTRTRTAFGSGALRLGAGVLAYGPHDLQIETGESDADTAAVLGGMLDGLVVRTAGPQAQLHAYARHCPLVNAMSAEEHPTQALADLTTLSCVIGDLAGLRMLYVGEGNNTAAALALALARVPGAELHLRTPAGYGLGPQLIAEADRHAAARAGRVIQHHDLQQLPTDVQVVYTTRWQTTGTTKADPTWRDAFAPFTVDGSLMARLPGALFMHDLPAHRGEEVTAEVLDGPASIAFRQARTKLPSAMAVLSWLFASRTGAEAG